MKVKSVVAVFLLLPLISGCWINLYGLWYKPYEDDQRTQFLESYEPCDSELEIISSSDLGIDTQELYRSGYVPGGETFIESSQRVMQRSEMNEHAQKIGACKVVYARKFSHTEFGSTTHSVPRETTTKKKDGSKKTTTTYDIVEVPTSDEIYEEKAIFFFKRSFVFGARIDEVPSGISAKIGKNGGVVIKTLVRGGPAHKADMFEGDVVLAVNGEKLNSADNEARFHDLLQSNIGQSISLLIWRNGETVKKTISLANVQLYTPVVEPQKK